MNILDEVRIASPCAADWNAMYGDDKRRFCYQCKLNVYNLAGMSSEEAEQFLLASEGGVCVRLFERYDGTMITENCPVGLAVASLRIRRYLTVAVSVVLSFVVGSGISRLINGPEPDVPTFSIPPSAPEKEKGGTKISFGGMVSNLDQVKEAILRDQREI